MDIIIFVKADLLCTRETHKLKALLEFLENNPSELKSHIALDVNSDGVVSAVPADQLFDFVPTLLYGQMLRHRNYLAISAEVFLEVLQESIS